MEEKKVEENNIAELAKALSQAQSLIEPAIKDSANPFFKSKYADLASVWRACREPLTKNGLSIAQLVSTGDNSVTVKTILLHSSGQSIESILTLMPKDKTPQSIGSAITYARRYALSAMVGISSEDDDGNLASGMQAKPLNTQEDFDKHNEDFYTQAEEDIDSLLNVNDVSIYKRNYKKQIDMLSEIKRSKILELLEEKTQMLITGSKAKSKLDVYCEKVHSFNDLKQLQEWWVKEQKEILKILDKESVTTLVQEYRFVVNELTPGKLSGIPQTTLVIAKENNWTEYDVIGYSKTLYDIPIKELKEDEWEVINNYILANPK